jgi:hypothetical protein
MTISKTPWQYNAQHMAVYDPQGRAIAVRPDFSSCAGVTEAADMQLVAAAPDMLAVLEWWQAQMRDDNCDDMGKLLDDMSAKAHAAIAKARGL